jgi:succinylarginine dihydrolase
LAQLRLAFADPAFAVHDPVPPPFGDEGAANHMRLAASHDTPGVEVFVYGISGGPFPARQHPDASYAIARRHGLDPTRTLFVQQSEEAIAAGAFHNDVVAVANGRVLFAHEHAFADKERFYDELRAALPEVEIVEVSAAEVSLADAIASYLFNAQLVTLPSGETALIVPDEARETKSVWAWLEAHVAGNGPIRQVEVVDVRQSMANGGGPACLRLRVVADPAAIDPRFLVDEARLDLIASVVEAHWPEAIGSDEIADPALVARIEAAHRALLKALKLSN